MKALIITKNRKAVIKEVPEPELRPDYFKVKPFAVAINPSIPHLPLPEIRRR
jgi:NADPH:quinone reductase-like Zn-dependent oxidoreductase